jgi:Oxidoreductase family, NAD-binding Rossmann fold
VTEQRFRVGIVGLEPGRGWAARDHVPALPALSDSYEIVGVANTSLASAQRAAAALGLPRAFNDVAELVPAGLKTWRRRMLLASMAGWHTTCARVPAARRALKMP